MTARHELSAALFAELHSVLRAMRDTENEASISLQGGSPASNDLPGLLTSLRALREHRAACTRLYERATDLLSRQKRSGTQTRNGRPDCGGGSGVQAWFSRAIVLPDGVGVQSTG
jgi:hypothetical protein